jgi:hypothetical protein
VGSERCCCGHRREDHVEYASGGTSAKGSRYVCTKDGCSLWAYCDLEVGVMREAAEVAKD